MIKLIVLGVASAAVVATNIWALDRWRLPAPERPATHPVAGKLYVDGVPVGNASIVFHPIGVHAAEIYRPVATSKSDGSYSLMTYTADDGAPAGEYLVTVVWPEPSLLYDECDGQFPHDRLKGKFAIPAESPLKVTVRRGNNEAPLGAFSTGGWSNPRKRDSTGE